MIGLSRSEQLTLRFYEWEERGRGWQTCKQPVDLEPSFHPFTRRMPRVPVVDDGKRSTLLSSIAGLFKGGKQETMQYEYDPIADIPPVSGYVLDCEERVTVFSVVLPKDEKLEIEDMGQLLLMLSYTAYPVSFEIVGTSASIGIQIAARESDAAHVYEQVKAYFPTAIVTEFDTGRDILADTATCVIDFGLKDEFMLPLRMAEDVEQDPFIGLFATLENLRKDERGIVQVLFKGAINPWTESIMRSVTDSKGGSFFADCPEMVKLAEEKISAPLFAVCIRVAGQANSDARAIEITKNLGTALVRLTSSESNILQPLSYDGYPLDDMIDDMLLRQSHRLGMILNSRELATLVHFPTPEIASAKVERDTKKTKAAPESARGYYFVLGKNTHHGNVQLVSIPDSLRLRHMHLIGATGTGKSTMLLSMISQDMEQGRGIAVLDPHGDLIESILGYVPKDRIDDVILIDPADGEFPVGFNILNAHSEIEKDILSSDLVAAFKRLSTSWGDQMNSVLANAILAFLESTEGGTLIDLRRFLIEKPYRDKYLKTVSDPHIVYYWQHEYPLLKSNSIGSILTRLDTFLRPKLIRNMVAQKKGLDFEHIMDTKKILLVKLSQGLIGTENSFLLGTFFVSKIYQAAMARQAKSSAERKDFFLYIDEFQHFITPSMSHILSGARKYHLGLILAHQDMQQLQKYDSELASSVVVNAGTRICFRLGDVDARRFGSGFSYFEAEDLENLHVGEAIARLEQPNFDFNLTTIPLPVQTQGMADTIRQLVISTSRSAYGTPKAQVEESLVHLSTVQEKETEQGILQVQEQEQQPESLQQATIQAPVKETPKTPTAPNPETQHRYLQMLIKKMAESRGYKARLEEPTPDGKGRVDVSLERSGRRIACEISVTTNDTWETHNVEKCLAAGYDEVLVCSDNAKTLEKIRKQIKTKLAPDLQAKVLTLEPHEAIRYFDRQIAEESTTEAVEKGYRIHVEYDGGSQDEMRMKRGHVVKAVTDSMRRREK